MPAVSFAHGRLKTGGGRDNVKTPKINTLPSKSSEKRNQSSNRSDQSAQFPAGLVTKSGAAELTSPKLMKRNNFNYKRSMSHERRIVQQLLSSKLFGHLTRGGSSESIKAARKNSQLGRFIQSIYFKCAITILICLSAVQMGIATNVDSEGAQTFWDGSEHVFTFVFAAEAILKLFVDGLPFFLDGWNLIDFFIASTSVLDAWILPLCGVDANIGFVRTFRLLRLLRIMRMLRIVPEILMVMEGIGASLRSLFWIIILLVAVLYACSIMSVELVGRSQHGFPSYSEEDDALLVSSKAAGFNNYMFFGTVARSMVSLLGIVFLAEWDVIVRPVFEKFPGMVLLFALIVVLLTLGVMNLIVGVIVENTTQAMEKERRVKEEEARQRKMQFIEELSDVFDNIDEDCDGALSWYECQKAALRGDEKLAQLVCEIDFPPGITFEEIFQMLDVDASGSLTQDEFINGMFRIVHCDTFQRDCLHLLAVGRVMSKMNSDKVDIVNSVRHEVRRALQEVLGGEHSVPTSPQNSPGKLLSAPGKCASPGSLSPAASHKVHSVASPGASESNWDYSSEQEENVSYQEDVFKGLRSFLTPREMEPIYDPLLQSDMVTRLHRAAKEMENKLGALFSILHEEQYNIHSHHSHHASCMRRPIARVPDRVPELRTGIFASIGNPSADSQQVADPTKLKLFSSNVGKASTVYVEHDERSPGHRMVELPSEEGSPRRV